MKLTTNFRGALQQRSGLKLIGKKDALRIEKRDCLYPKRAIKKTSVSEGSFVNLYRWGDFPRLRSGQALPAGRQVLVSLN